MSTTEFIVLASCIGLSLIVLGVLFMGYLHDREQLRLTRMKRDSDRKRHNQWIR